jgi:hypothetical protein
MCGFSWEIPFVVGLKPVSSPSLPVISHVIFNEILKVIHE